MRRWGWARMWLAGIAPACSTPCAAQSSLQKPCACCISMLPGGQPSAAIPLQLLLWAHRLPRRTALLQVHSCAGSYSPTADLCCCRHCMGCRLVLVTFLSSGCGSVTLGALQCAYRRAPGQLACGVPGGHQESQHPSSLSGSRAEAALQLPRPAGGSADALKAAAAQRTLSYREAFWLATMGGAQTLGLQVPTQEP